MKVLFAIKAFDTMQWGAERVLSEVAAGLADRGHDVTVLSFDREGGTSFYPLPANIRRVRLGIGTPENRAGFFETVRRMRALRRFIRTERPDVAIGFMHSMFIPLAFSLAGTGIPVIASEHIVPEHYKTRPLQFLLLLASTPFAARITVLSESVKALYPSFMQTRMVVVPNPVRAPGRLAQPGDAGHTQKTILNVGRLDPQKDQKTLIAAFALLSNQYPEWSLRIVGEGALRPSLEQEIKTLGLEQRISLPGVTSDIGAEYARSHIFAISSSYESFGLATAEALASGLPAVGFADCPGTNALIRNGLNGILVSGPDRTQSFANGLEALMHDAALRERYGAKAQETLALYKPEDILDIWEEIVLNIQSHQD